MGSVLQGMFLQVNYSVVFLGLLVCVHGGPPLASFEIVPLEATRTSRTYQLRLEECLRSFCVVGFVPCQLGSASLVWRMLPLPTKHYVIMSNICSIRAGHITLQGTRLLRCRIGALTYKANFGDLGMR